MVAERLAKIIKGCMHDKRKHGQNGHSSAVTSYHSFKLKGQAKTSAFYPVNVLFVILILRGGAL